MKQRKYRNKPTEVDGIRFASKREAKRYGELKLLQRAGEINNLVLQPRWAIKINDHKICTYIADFAYYEAGAGSIDMSIVEDVKGVRTPVYKLKKKLMKAVHGIDIVEI